MSNNNGIVVASKEEIREKLEKQQSKFFQLRASL